MTLEERIEVWDRDRRSHSNLKRSDFEGGSFRPMTMEAWLQWNPKPEERT